MRGQRDTQQARPNLKPGGMLCLDSAQGVCKVQEGVCCVQGLSIILLICPVILL